MRKYIVMWVFDHELIYQEFDKDKKELTEAVRRHIAEVPAQDNDNIFLTKVIEQKE